MHTVSAVSWHQWFSVSHQYAQVYSNLKLRIATLCALPVFSLFFLIFLVHMLKHISVWWILFVHT